MALCAGEAASAAFFPNYILYVPRFEMPNDSRQAGQISSETMRVGRAAFYGVLDMPPFSSATVDDLVSAIACAVLKSRPTKKETKDGHNAGLGKRRS
jgi:hypothetical protein